MTEHSRAEHIAFMRDPGEWPQWPVLPLTRIGTAWEDLSRLGCIICFVNTMMRVYHCGMWELPKMLNASTLSGYKYTDYRSLEAIYDDGWRVD